MLKTGEKWKEKQINFIKYFVHQRKWKIFHKMALRKRKGGWKKEKVSGDLVSGKYSLRNFYNSTT